MTARRPAPPIYPEADAFLNILMVSHGLREILDIQRRVCLNQEKGDLSRRAKNFRSLRFVYFGLLTKSAGMVEMLQLKCDSFAGRLPEFEGIQRDLLDFKADLVMVQGYIEKNRLEEAWDGIIGLSEKYETIYPSIKNAAARNLQAHFGNGRMKAKWQCRGCRT